MLRNFTIIILAFCILLPKLTLANTIQEASVEIAEQLDAQLMKEFSLTEKTGKISFTKKVKSEDIKSKISIAVTTPVDLNDLTQTCTLARQVAEEITSYMVNEGYTFEEMRKGKEIIFTEKKGETLLTRNTKDLVKKDVTTVVILVGTYTITKNEVRLNIKLIGTGNNEVLAMASSTISVNRNLLPLLVNSKTTGEIIPSIGTRLQ